MKRFHIAIYNSNSNSSRKMLLWYFLRNCQIRKFAVAKMLETFSLNAIQKKNGFHSICKAIWELIKKYIRKCVLISVCWTMAINNKHIFIDEKPNSKTTRNCQASDSLLDQLLTFFQRRQRRRRRPHRLEHALQCVILSATEINFIVRFAFGSIFGVIVIVLVS